MVRLVEVETKGGEIIVTFVKSQAKLRLKLGEAEDLLAGLVGELSRDRPFGLLSAVAKSRQRASI